MMIRAGFLYDNSISANPGLEGEAFWPQTLDYKLSFACTDKNCPMGYVFPDYEEPLSSFPGIWEVPLNQFYGSYMRQIDSHRRSSMIRAAVDLNATIPELVSPRVTLQFSANKPLNCVDVFQVDMLVSNFERSYHSNRAPFVLTLNADFLQLNGRRSGMQALKL